MYVYYCGYERADENYTSDDIITYVYPQGEPNPADPICQGE